MNNSASGKNIQLSTSFCGATKKLNLGSFRNNQYGCQKGDRDRVWHGFLYKLIKANFPSYLTDIVSSFLKGRSFRVCISNSVSEVEAGVPQGSVLSLLHI